MPEKCEAVFRESTAISKKYGFGIKPSALKTWFPESAQALPEKCEAVFRESTATSKKYGFWDKPHVHSKVGSPKVSHQCLKSAKLFLEKYNSKIIAIWGLNIQ
ncbi:hypothetical protein [Bartonella choladocola]|uniref:hypothetical protein n=1 Tax=Bartonella choladocola TaxID=2750995 RepID=UPI003B51CE6D